jgi:ketosteroid isomerase-like protein
MKKEQREHENMSKKRSNKDKKEKSECEASELAVRKFIQFINKHDVNRMTDLMTENHKFKDAIGVVVSGRERLKTGWLDYFKWFPDYKIEVKEIFSHGNTFVVIGFASGTFAGKRTNQSHWRLPAAWRVVVLQGQIKEWNVYCDTKWPYDIIVKNEPQSRN